MKLPPRLISRHQQLYFAIDLVRCNPPCSVLIIATNPVDMMTHGATRIAVTSNIGVLP